MEKCPKSGLHNPLKNVERYAEYGQIFHRAAMALEDVIFHLKPRMKREPSS